MVAETEGSEERQGRQDVGRHKSEPVPAQSVKEWLLRDETFRDPDHLTAEASPRPASLRDWLLREEPFDAAMNPSFLGFFAQVGCLGVLQREGLLKRLIGLAGASAGSMSGSFIASGNTVLVPREEAAEAGLSELTLHEDMQRVVDAGQRRWKEVLDVSPGLGLLKGQVFEDLIAESCVPTFQDTSVPFACTAWSAYAMRTEILRSGPLASAVRASCNVPGLLQPSDHNRRRWLLDGGIMDPSGSAGLRALAQQPRRSLHIVVNRTMAGIDKYWTRTVPPSEFGAPREEVLTLRLNRPPTLLLGERSGRLLGKAVTVTAEAVLESLDAPLRRGREDGHWVLEVNVDWGVRGRKLRVSQRLALPQSKL